MQTCSALMYRLRQDFSGLKGTTRTFSVVSLLPLRFRVLHNLNSPSQPPGKISSLLILLDLRNVRAGEPSHTGNHSCLDRVAVFPPPVWVCGVTPDCLSTRRISAVVVVADPRHITLGTNVVVVRDCVTPLLAVTTKAGLILATLIRVATGARKSFVASRDWCRRRWCCTVTRAPVRAVLVALPARCGELVRVASARPHQGRDEPLGVLRQPTECARLLKARGQFIRGHRGFQCTPQTLAIHPAAACKPRRGSAHCDGRPA